MAFHAVQLKKSLRQLGSSLSVSAESIEPDIDFRSNAARLLGRDQDTFDLSRIFLFDFVSWSISLAIAVFSYVVLRFQGRGLDFSGLDTTLILTMILMVAGIIYRLWRPAPRLAAGSAIMVELFIYGFIFTIFSYVCASLSGTDVSKQIADIDHLLRFNWVDYHATIVTHPWLSAILLTCYNSIAIQALGIIALFLLSGHFGWLRVLINCFALGAAVTMLVMAVFPVVSADAYYGIAQLGPDGMSSGIGRIDDFLKMRAGAMSTISVQSLTGIVSFPSFHTYLAILYVTVMAPFPRLRWLFIAVNALLIAGAPVFGAHYLTDILAGMGVATVVIGGGLALIRKPHYSARSQPLPLASAG